MTRHSLHQPWLRSAAMLAAAVWAAGCAETVGDIDRTQPDLVAKDHFQGQWFLRETVVDVPPTSPVSFVGIPGDLEMIVWDIQQDYLVGYRAYEQVPGLDGRAEADLAKPSIQPVTPGLGEGRDPSLYKGNPVVAYKIEGHVDVQRGYNARTGEQNNIISENTSDRPWQDRAFMRVDWSHNAVDNLVQLSPVFSAFSSMSSYVPQNEGGADAFHMETDDEGRANYIDFTTRLTAEPSVMGCTAMMNSRLGDCTGEEIRVRTSLLKVDPEEEQQYVPLVYDDRREGEFGYFRVERPSYDRRLGNTFTGLIQVAGRHDLWAHSRDASGEPLAFSARTLKPLNYTLSENFPDELREIADEIGQEYDASFKKVVAASRDQGIEDLERDLIDDTGDSCLFCIDTNEDNKARNGDIRHNFIYWVDDLQAAGPLGFGPSSLNPETGRIVSASAYVYGASVDKYAELAKEIVELMIPENEGGLTEEQIKTGQYFRDAVRADLSPLDPRKAARLNGLSGAALGKEILGQAGLDRIAELARDGKEGLPLAVPGLEASRLQRIVGTELEAKMIPEEWQRLQATDAPSFLKSRAALLQKRAEERGEPAPNFGPMGALSVTNWFGADALKDTRELEDIASRNNLWLANFDDPSIAGLAREVKDMGVQGDDLFNLLRGRVFRAVMLHELGHTMGLRHNFAGSADALNFQDDYWPQRVKTIAPVAQYTQGTAPSLDAFLRSNCSVQGPLQLQNGTALTATDTTAECDEQLSGKMAELQYSSIMDYGSRFNSDFHGLGHYDIAALASGYADLVEVFDDQAMEGIAAGSQATGVDVRTAMALANTVRNPILSQGLDNAMAQVSSAGMRLSHYTNYPTLVGGAENLARRRFMPRSEYLAQLADSQNLSAAERARVPMKVPYLSCYDEYVDSVDTCHRYDAGADNYEIVSSLLTGYREYYVFNNFQKDRVGFDPFSVAQRTAQRYFLPLTNMYQHWLWGLAITGLTPEGSPRGDLGLVATRQGLERLLNTMSTPEYGPHMYDPASGEYVPVNGQCPEVASDVTIPVPLAPDNGTVVGTPPVSNNLMTMPSCVDVPQGVGRSFFSRYDSSGYDVFRRVLESGHYYDQLAAMAALQASNASVVGIGSDVNADARTFRIPYNLAFPTDLEDIFANIYREDDTKYALHIERTQGSAVGQVVERSVFTNPADLAALPVIAPGRSYTTRVQALVAGMNLLDGTLNPKFARQGQISLVGSGEQREVPTGFEEVSLADPASGRVFVAYRKAGNVDGPWYAADLIETAQKIVADPASTANDKASVFGDIELVRLAYGVFGQ